MNSAYLLETEDFRMKAAEALRNQHGGITVLRECESLEAGRWEPFVSIVGVYTLNEWRQIGRSVMQHANRPRHTNPTQGAIA